MRKHWLQLQGEYVAYTSLIWPKIHNDLFCRPHFLNPLSDAYANLEESIAWRCRRLRVWVKSAEKVAGGQPDFWQFNLVTNLFKMYHCNTATLGCSIAQSSRRGTINGDASSISGLSRQTGEPPNSARPFPSFSFARQALFWVQVSYLGFKESIELQSICVRRRTERTPIAWKSVISVVTISVMLMLHTQNVIQKFTDTALIHISITGHRMMTMK